MSVHFTFLGITGEALTPTEESAWDRLVAQAKVASGGEDILDYCKRVCSPGHCDLLPCPIGRYGKGPDK